MFLMPGLIIASYVTNTPLPEAHRTEMMRYLRNHQNADGGWGTHIESPNSTMFGSVLNYVSMRLLGASAAEPMVAKARAFIKQHGGAVGTPSWGKFWLCVLGAFEWSGVNSLFPEMWLLPYFLPFHPGRYWCHCRMVYLPMSYLYGVRFVGPITPLVQSLREEIFVEQYDQIKWASIRSQVAIIDKYTPQALVLKLIYAALNAYEAMHIPAFRRKAVGT